MRAPRQAGRAGPAAFIAIVGVIAFWFNSVGVNLLMKGLHCTRGSDMADRDADTILVDIYEDQARACTA